LISNPLSAGSAAAAASRPATPSLPDAPPIWADAAPSPRTRPAAARPHRWSAVSPDTPPAREPPSSCQPPSAIRPGPAKEPLQSRSEEHTSELQSRENRVCRLLLEKRSRVEER